MVRNSRVEPVDSGHPSDDPRNFRRCLGQFATGVTVITAQAENQLAGVTANSFSSVSLDPPLILWSISRKSRSYATFEAASHFAVNILASNQIDISQRFSSSEIDKFSDIGWRAGSDGAPLIDGAAATLECRVEAVHKGGDHDIIVGHVQHFARYPNEVLLFVQGRYGVAQDHPELVERPIVPGTPLEVEGGLLPLLFQAYRHMSEKFDEHRRAEGVRLAQGRILAGIFDHPGQPLDRLVQSLYLGRRDAEDATADLLERRLISQEPDGSLLLTLEGRKRRLAIAKRWAEFQSERLGRFSQADIDVASKVLKELLSDLPEAPRKVGAQAY